MHDDNLYEYVIHTRPCPVSVSFRTATCDTYYTTNVPKDSLLATINKYADVAKDENIITVIRYNNGDISLIDLENIFEFMEILRYYGINVRNEEIRLFDVIELFPDVDLSLSVNKICGNGAWLLINNYDVLHRHFYNCTLQDVKHLRSMTRTVDTLYDDDSYDVFHQYSYNIYANDIRAQIYNNNNITYVSIYFIMHILYNISPSILYENIIYNDCTHTGYATNIFNIIHTDDPMEICINRLIRHHITYTVNDVFTKISYNGGNVNEQQHELLYELFLSMPLCYKDQMDAIGIPLNWILK